MLNQENISRNIGMPIEELRSITQYCHEYILILDVKGNILFVNKSDTVPVCEMNGKNIFSFLRGADSEVLRAALHKTISLCEGVKCKVNYLDKSGRKRNFAISIGPLVNSNNVVGLVLNALETSLDEKSDEKDLELIETEKNEHAANQRSVLVREVHHRIKNNLQGIIGLLTDSLQGHPELQQKMQTVLSHIRSIALIHGIQGQSIQSELVLCELVPAIVNSVRISSDVPIEVNLNIDVMRSIQISSEDAVPIALVLNELLFNAVKHRPVSDHTLEVKVELNGDSKQGEIRIFTPGAGLPVDFDFSKEKCLGTGLELVKALMPHKGAQLKIQNTNHGVESVLKLSYPVIFMKRKSGK